MSFIKGKQIASSSIEMDKLARQESAKVLLGQGAGAAVEFKSLSGDAAIDATGVLTIASSAIDSTKLAANAVTTVKIAANAVTAAKIADGEISTAKLADGSVTTIKLADDSVSTAKLQASSVSTAKIAAGAVTLAKLNGDVISTANDLSEPGKLPTSLAVKTYVDNNIPAALASTDDLPQGVNNLYFTEAAARAAAVVNAVNGDEANKAPSVHSIVTYVDEKFNAAIKGLDFHAPCKTASSANVNIASAPAAISGYSFGANGERVLLKDQTDAKQNGIYDWNGAGNALTRSADSNDVPDGEVTGGMFTFIQDGDLAGTSWVLTIPSSGVVLGTDDLIFAQFASNVAYAGAEGITVSGLNVSLALSELGALTAGNLVKGHKLALVDSTDSSNKVTTIESLASFLADGTTISALNGKLTAAAGGSTSFMKRDLFTTPTAVAANATGTTGCAITATPANDSTVQVFINGILGKLSSDLNSELFFSRNNGVSAVAIADIAANDVLFFNGTANGFALEADDVIQIVYLA